MAVRTRKSVFFHIPKTGGIWVKEAMRKSGLEYNRCINKRKIGHPFGLKREHAPPSVLKEGDSDGLFSFCFVRHPVDWYRSFWAYVKKRKAYDARFPAYDYWSDNIVEFIEAMLYTYPDGYVTQLYGYYDLDRMNYVGRQENLREDLITALTMAGETFDADVIRNLYRFNVGASQVNMQKATELPGDLIRRIEEIEYCTIERYYG